MTDTRVVVVQGARQVGKSTLTTLLSPPAGAVVRTLDDPSTLAAALSDPSGFVEHDAPMVIDEIQRAPELLLAIKARVDRDPRPGRFLLTGSAGVLTLPGIADALPGRMEIVDLWPLSQGEIDSAPDGLVDALFERGADVHHASHTTRQEYAERLCRGGYPDAVARSPRRRDAYFDAYMRTMVERDIRDLSRIEQVPQMRRLIMMLAARQGSTFNATNLADRLGGSRATVQRYVALLTQTFLVLSIPAWSRNLSTRASATHKVVFVDSGIAAHAVGATPHNLLAPDSALGLLLEGFVVAEVARQRTWSTHRVDQFHYRTKDGVEVDCVLEDRRGRVVAIEVKAASTVRASDFRGITHLRERLGDDLVVGVVLYTGLETLRFGDRLLALPISALWETPAALPA